MHNSRRQKLIGAFAFFAVLLLGFLSQPTVAQESSSVITSIEVEGLTRTKYHVVERALVKFLGVSEDEFDENDVFAAILNLGVLTPLSVEFIENENGATLSVTVEERRTMFPLPMVMSGSGGSMYGAFVLQSNMFGERDMAVLGAMFGDFGWSAITMYNHTPRRAGLPGGTVAFMYGHNENTAINKDEDTVRIYAANILRASLGVNYSFADFITASFSVSYSDIALDENVGDTTFLNPPDSGATMLTLTPSLTFRKSGWDGYFLSQQSLTFRYNYNHALIGESYHQAEISGTYEQPIIDGLRLNLRCGGVWKSTDYALFEEGPSRARVEILPRNFAAMQYAGFSFGIERYLRTTSWATLSAQLSWQGVYYEGELSGDEFNYGPALGLHFYLSRMALPAMGLVLGYNINAELAQLNFSMGLSF